MYQQSMFWAKIRKYNNVSSENNHYYSHEISHGDVCMIQQNVNNDKFGILLYSRSNEQCWENMSLRLATRLDTNWAVQLKEMAITKAQNRRPLTAQLISTFVFPYAKSRVFLWLLYAHWLHSLSPPLFSYMQKAGVFYEATHVIVTSLKRN